MGFLDDLKERFGFGGGGGDDYYDDYYDDEEGQDSFEEESRRASRRGRDRDYDRDYQPSSVPRVQHDYEGEPQGLLGNTSRPTAESVSVYTRSGHLVDSNSGLRDAAAPAPYSRNAAVTGDSAWTDSRLDYTPSASASGYGANPQNTGVMRPIPTAPAPSYGKPLTNLPPYVLRPEAYDDCTTIMKRVRTSQPVVLAFAETDMEIAKRILDFCFGFACGINGRVEELGEKTFAILPEGVELTKAAYDKLIRDGVIEGSVE